MTFRFRAHQIFAYLLACVPYYLCGIEPVPENNSSNLSHEILEAGITLADEFFDAGLFQQAVTAYQDVLNDVTAQNGAMADTEQKARLLQVAAKARFHLAQVFFSLEKYDETLALLEENIKEEQTTRQLQELKDQALYTMALAYKGRHQYALAIETFQQYLKRDVFPLAFGDETQFEIGVVYYLWGKNAEARQQLMALGNIVHKPQLHVMAQIYLSRIDLSQGKYKEAASILDKLHALLPVHDRLHFEISYLQGEVHFHLHDYSRAIEFFEKSLPLQKPQNAPWYGDTLYYLGWCYLKMGDDPLKNASAQASAFTKAEEIFQKLLAIRPQERAYLALGQCYLSCAKRLHNEEAYARAEALLSQQDIFLTREAQTQALFLRAEAASSYDVRDKFYRQLTLESNSDTSFYAKGWYLRALNDYENGLVLLSSGQSIDLAQQIIDIDGGNERGRALIAFERAAAGFAKAFILLRDNDPALAGMALKYRALAMGHHNSRTTDLQAFLLIDELIHMHPDLWHAMESPDEILYLHGFFATRLNEDEKYAAIAEKSLKAAAQYPQGNFGDIALRHLGAMLYRHGDYAAAEAVYLQLVDNHPSSPLAGEAWFWAACCSDNLQKDMMVGKERRRHAFEDFPLSPYAAEAFFTLYTYQEYLQGERNAIKHLQSFVEKYRDSPFLIEAYYLIGLDYKRDRKTPEGKWLRKRNLTEAIDAFQEVETQFDLLAEKKLIPADKFDYYVAVRYRAILERALANLAISDESQGAKRQIYLEYAEEVFLALVKDFDTPTQYTKLLYDSESYPALYEESSFWLAQTFVRAQNDMAAESIFTKMLERYRQAKVTRGYYLSRIWYELGKIALRAKKYAPALQSFKQAEDAAKGNHVLSTDQRLDLWIQQSMSYRGLEQYDQAILILSKVVNDDAISSLRLKAMYLRAETYEQQGRPELARKQLESMVKKGGIWALKAQEKLGTDYGY